MSWSENWDDRRRCIRCRARRVNRGGSWGSSRTGRWRSGWMASGKHSWSGMRRGDIETSRHRHRRSQREQRRIWPGFFSGIPCEPGPFYGTIAVFAGELRGGCSPLARALGCEVTLGHLWARVAHQHHAEVAVPSINLALQLAGNGIPDTAIVEVTIELRVRGCSNYCKRMPATVVCISTLAEHRRRRCWGWWRTRWGCRSGRWSNRGHGIGGARNPGPGAPTDLHAPK